MLSTEEITRLVLALIEARGDGPQRIRRAAKTLFAQGDYEPAEELNRLAKEWEDTRV